MNTIDRRQFLKYLGGSSALLAAMGPLASCGKPAPTATGRVIIVGGGFGGSTCAKYLHRFDPMLDITLIEPAERFVTCPFSNMVMTDMRDLNSISHSYAAHSKRGVKVVHASVTEIDAVAKKVSLDNGSTHEYDRLVLSPGIDFRWETIEGMGAADADTIPHAWQGGPQTTILREQLSAMPDGGVFIIAPPPNPFRCPPGPYERVSLIANYFKQHKPNAKILVLDAKDKFSKQPLFMQGWEALYPGMIEWVSGSNGGRVYRIDPATREVETENGDIHKGDVVNFIPPQKAAPIAHTAGLTNNDGWCPVDQRSFESALHPGVHVIGDASIAGKMPKSGFAANSQGKVCAAAIVSALHGVEMPDPSYVNTCYSLVAPDYGISVAAVYRYSPDKGIYKVEGSGGVSPKDADAAFREKEARYTEGWYASITSDAFG
ncbi:MAG: FCSD flavin-binding domain-containing protein [Granulosicoccaceae bacterium]|jgi:sulfide dehydrogenase [flavocytochrome c] flavoprotein subunit